MDPLYRPEPFANWCEEDGDVLWWRHPICEPPYLGSPLCLGRSVTATVTFGFEEAFFHGKMFGGWPFDADDEPSLWWTPLPDANRIHETIEALSLPGDIDRREG